MKVLYQSNNNFNDKTDVNNTIINSIQTQKDFKRTIRKDNDNQSQRQFKLQRIIETPYLCVTVNFKGTMMVFPQ